MKLNNIILIKLLSIIFILLNVQLSFSQFSTDMMKYWFYRDRINKYFVIPGEKKGESEIICVRNRTNPDNDPYDFIPAKNADYGQHSVYQGYYIGVLATEYYLLKQNGQTDDAAKTAYELYLALEAFQEQNDVGAENYWPPVTSYNCQGQSNYSHLNGFFIRDNTPGSFFDLTHFQGNNDGFSINGVSHVDLLNKGLTINDVYNPSLHCFGNQTTNIYFPKGHPGYIDHRTSVGTTILHPGFFSYTLHGVHTDYNYPEPLSQDEAYGIMLGLGLTIKLTDDNIPYDNNGTTVYSSCHARALSLFNLLSRYIINLDLLYGGNKWSIMQPYCPLLNSPTPVVEGNSTYRFGKGLIMAAHKITTYDFGHISGNAQNCWWASESNNIYGVVGSGNAWMVASLAAMGDSWSNTGAGLHNVTARFNWDTFYILLWEVLNNTTRHENNQNELLTKALDQLNNGPCEGPYSYLQDVYNYNELGQLVSITPGIHAGGGWSATYKWHKDNDVQNHGDNWYGNFNGLDYMLLYNLYHIKNLGTAGMPAYVNYVDRNLIGTVNVPVKFIAFNSITSTQEINQTTPTVIYKAGDNIELKPGFHAIVGSEFHAYISDIDCREDGSSSKSLDVSDYPDNMYTPFYDSLISVLQTPYPSTLKDDTNAINNLVTLDCPIDTIKFMGINGDTVGDTYSYFWDFGNGQTSTSKSPCVFYTPGRYNFTLILTDTSGIIDTMKVIIVAPDCSDSLGIYGTLSDNPSCGGSTITNDTLWLVNANDSIVQNISIAATDSIGKFNFKKWELLALDTTALFGIKSKSGLTLNDTAHKTISQWISESPLNLYYTTSVNQEWVARYNGADSLNDGATAIDLMGNIYVTGASTSATNGYDMTTIKYDSTGTQLWAEIYNGTGNGNDAARAITVDSSGNVYITGESKGSDNKTIITTVSYTNSGTQRWLQLYSNASCTGSSATCIAQDHAGNIIVGGTSSCTSSSNLYTVLKYNSNGNLIWDSYYSGSLTVPDNTLKALSVDDSNNVYVSGTSLGSGTAYDMTTVKFNSGGTQLWADSYDNPNHTNDYAYSNAINNNGNIVVGGYSHRSGGNDEAIVINYTSGGSRNWLSVYNNDSHDFAYKVLCNTANDIYIAGNSGITSSLTMLALKYDVAGNLSWAKHTLPSSTYNFKSAAIDIADNLYITGTTQIAMGGKYITTQKLNSESDVQWTRTYNIATHINDFPSQIKISQNGNVYISGYSLADSTAYDFITLKYSQCPLTAANLKTNNTASGQNTITTIKENSFIQIIPNPNNGNMQVSYEIPENTTGTFEVYNLMGEKLFSYSLFSGKNTFSIFRSELEQGIYFYRATAGNRQIAADKIVVIK